MVVYVLEENCIDKKGIYQFKSRSVRQVYCKKDFDCNDLNNRMLDFLKKKVSEEKFINLLIK